MQSATGAGFATVAESPVRKATSASPSSDRSREATDPDRPWVRSSRARACADSRRARAASPTRSAGSSSVTASAASAGVDIRCVSRSRSASVSCARDTGRGVGAVVLRATAALRISSRTTSSLMPARSDSRSAN